MDFDEDQIPIGMLVPQLTAHYADWRTWTVHPSDDQSCLLNAHGQLIAGIDRMRAQYPRTGDPMCSSGYIVHAQTPICCLCTAELCIAAVVGAF